MGKATIVNIVEHPLHIAPGKVEVDLEIMYRTAKGFEGTVTISKKGATEERIWDAVFADMKTVETVMGETK
ncbi:hypothetical protein D4Q85_00655 [bacterium]|nr:MAG: hypothetical protein D4Q85_00655 [bacterium]